MIIYEEILRDFKKERVKYLLVGGIAFNLHGGLRNTADLDILVEMSDQNLEKIVRILKKRGYRVRQPVDPMGIADQKTREGWIHRKHMKAFNFYKDNGLEEVDLIINTPVTYIEAVRKVVRIRVGDILLPIISLDHLIKMKQNTGRPIDQLDVAELKKIKKLKGKK